MYSISRPDRRVLIATSTAGYRLFVDPAEVEDLQTVAAEIADLIGGEALERAAAVLRPGGRVVTTLAGSMRAPVAASLSMAYLRMRSTTADLAAVAGHVDAGELTLPVRVRLPIEDVDGPGIERRSVIATGYQNH